MNLQRNLQEKDEYQYLYKKVGELKGENIENEGIVEYGNHFISCKINSDIRSK